MGIRLNAPVQGVAAVNPLIDWGSGNAGAGAYDIPMYDERPLYSGGGSAANTAINAAGTAGNTASDIIGALAKGGESASPLGWAQFGVNTLGQIASLFGGGMSKDEKEAIKLRNMLMQQQYQHRGSVNSILEALSGAKGAGTSTGSVAERYAPVRAAATEGTQAVRDALSRLPANMTLQDLLNMTQPMAKKFTAARSAALAPERREQLRRITEGSPSSVAQQSALAYTAQEDLNRALEEMQAEQMYAGMAEQRVAAQTDEARAMAAMGGELPKVAASGVTPELSQLLQSLSI